MSNTPSKGAHAHDHHRHGEAVVAGVATVKDPVCGMTIDPETAHFRADEGGKAYYFCSSKCREKFVADPQRFVAAATTNASPAEHRDHVPSHAACCSGHDRATPGVVEVKDPVCGMTVDPATAKHKAAYAGQTYFFCSAGCREKFVADPLRYVGANPAPPPQPAPAGAIYTCPMHPEIRQAGPGACPICGMALAPEMATAAEGPNPELVDMTRRFWVG